MKGAAQLAAEPDERPNAAPGAEAPRLSPTWPAARRPTCSRAAVRGANSAAVAPLRRMHACAARRLSPMTLGARAHAFRGWTGEGPAEPTPFSSAPERLPPSSPCRMTISRRGEAIALGTHPRYSSQVKPSVYLETSVVSYLVGWLNRNSLLVASNQELTREWWAARRSKFDLFASTLVIDEVREGKLGQKRVDLLAEVQILDVTPDARSLGARLVREAAIPVKAEIDALHVAIAAANGMDYLLSWNCTHIVNAVTLPRVYEICRNAGYEPPFVCTPQELMEPDND